MGCGNRFSGLGNRSGAAMGAGSVFLGGSRQLEPGELP